MPRPAKVDIGFTGDRSTGAGGAALLAEATRRFGLAERLAEVVSARSGTAARRTQRRSGA